MGPEVLAAALIALTLPADAPVVALGCHKDAVSHAVICRPVEPGHDSAPRYSPPPPASGQETRAHAQLRAEVRRLMSAAECDAAMQAALAAEDLEIARFVLDRCHRPSPDPAPTPPAAHPSTSS